MFSEVGKVGCTTDSINASYPKMVGVNGTSQVLHTTDLMMAQLVHV